MQPQQFQIESYELKNNAINVIVEKYDIIIPIEIPLDKFEWWLRTEDKLNWVIDTSDHRGVHQQFSGTMSLSEYWETESDYIKTDLYEYIISHPIKNKKNGVVFTNSLESILLDFDLHNASRVNPQPYERWEHDQELELIN